VVDTIDEDSKVHRVASTHVEPKKAELLRGSRGVPALAAEGALAVPMVAHGRMIGTITCASPTAARHVEAHDRATLSELAHRAAVAIENARLFEKARDAVQIREDFLAVASHELHTPLTSLMLTVQSLTRGTKEIGPPAAKSQLALIDRQSRRLAKLVDDLLDVSRIEAGRLPIECERVDFAAVVREVVERFADESRRANSVVSVAIDEPMVGTWDRSRLDQIVSNLLSNALKFGPGAPIEVALSREGACAVLAVQDHGMGIAAERMPRIFDRFERGVSVRHFGGLGLGLYIVRSIVEAFGGVVRCESAVGRGARFVVSLPFDRPAERAGDEGPP
jgi:signal transduction histidine kinase